MCRGQAEEDLSENHSCFLFSVTAVWGFLKKKIIFMMSFRSRRNKEDAKCLVWLGVSFMDICLKYKVEP